MSLSLLLEHLTALFPDESLYGFSPIDSALAAKTGCKCALVTLLPFPDLEHRYNPVEFLNYVYGLARMNL